MVKFIFQIKYWISKILLTALLVTTIWCVTTYSTHINLFNIEKISVVGNTFVIADEILEEINKDVFESLIELNLENIKSNVNEIEYIQTAKVFRILPSTVVVEVVERVPIVLVNDGKRMYMVDSFKELLTASNEAINHFPIPVINFENNSIITPDELILTVLNILQLYPELYSEMSELNNIQNEYVFVSDNRTIIYFGDTKIQNKIILLREFLHTVMNVREMNNYSYIDLRIPNQVIVKERGIKYNS